jgi:hypothetical protein
MLLGQVKCSFRTPYLADLANRRARPVLSQGKLVAALRLAVEAKGEARTLKSERHWMGRAGAPRAELKDGVARGYIAAAGIRHLPRTTARRQFEGEHRKIEHGRTGEMSATPMRAGK